MEQSILFLITLRKYGQSIFITKTIIAISLLFLVVKLTIALTFPYYILPQFILGALYAHMVELQHEALHGATQWKWLNRTLGILLGMPMLISYSDYQYHHMLHHEHVGTDKDTEYFNYSVKKTFSLYKFILSLFMFEHYKNVFKKICRAVFLNKLEVQQENIKQKIKNECQLFLIIILCFSCLSIVFESSFILKLWAIPLFLFATPIHFLMELPEHVFCERNNKDIFVNTRTIKSNWLMSWFVNSNNYHVEHHYAPNYPIAALSDLNKEIGNKIVYFEQSYLDFYKSFFKRLLKNQ